MKQNLLTLNWTAEHDIRLQQNEKPTQKERITLLCLYHIEKSAKI